MAKKLPFINREGPVFCSSQPALKLLYVLTFVCFSTVSFTSERVYAQTGRFNFNLSNVPIVRVFEQIEAQSNYRVLYTQKTIEKGKPVSLKLNDATLQTLLTECFRDQPFTYYVEDSSIIVVPKSSKGKSGQRLRTLDSTINVNGHVLDEKGLPLPGATIKVKGSSLGVTSDANGDFQLNGVPEGSRLIVSFIGYTAVELVATKENIIITLKQSAAELHEVMVSTGYQDLPAERATGSFVKVDSTLLNRRVSTNFIDRLEGVTSGLIFNRNLSPLDPNASPISIRGRSTIFANTSPLIIVDNFPYEGDLDNINPNDIANITVLKDAAAASIWGARAANGVIVVTTKKGRTNQPLQVNLSSNITVGAKPDLYYDPNFLNASDFIDFEKNLFSQGYYDANLSSNSTRNVVTPVVDILAAERSGTITPAQADAQINALRSNDVRKDFQKYFYRPSFDQQHSLSFSGGGSNATYLFSAGYDQNLSNLARNDYDRITLNENSTYTPFKHLELDMGLHYAQNRLDNNNPGISGYTSNGSAIYPYAQLADGQGNALTIARDYPNSFKNAQTGLLDWQYRPLDELHLANNQTHINDIRVNPSLKYSFNSWLSAEIRYQYEKQITESDNIQSQDSYYVRNIVNLYSQVNGTTVTRPVPYGDIYDQGLHDFSTSIIRGQLDLNKSIGAKGFLSAIAGLEYQEQITNIKQNRLYGYSPDVATSTPVDYTTIFPQYQDLYYDTTIPYNNKVDVATNEFRSYYANASYTYDEKYTISGSARYDQSNLFGVNTNQKGVPLWSAGLSWNISRESFYNLAWMPDLKLRATYGVNGNIDKSLTAYTTGYYSLSAVTNAPDVWITNPPNPDLQWEQDRMLNIGIDFGMLNRRISGSAEYYHRIGTNLVGYTNADPTTGFYTFKGNVADMQGSGIDLQINSKNLTGALGWTTTFLFSRATNKVTKYNPIAVNSNHVQSGDGTLSGTSSSTFTPVVGKPVYSVYSYKWAGLDPQTGDPQGYVNGTVSKDYGAIANSANINDLVYNGSATPTMFGALRNDFTYRSLTLSVNITYKLGYYFRRPSINYSNLAGLYIGNADYTKRWQKPGDEATTSVPSFVYPLNTLRDNFYNYSSILVERGDHVRLQDIRLSYVIKNVHIGKTTFPAIQLFTYANNLGIIWKATKTSLDPDFLTGYPNPKTISFGFNAHF